MKTHLKRIVFLAIVLLLGMQAYPNQGHAKVFINDEGDFSANFPSTPIPGQADKKTIVGTIQEKWFTAKTPSGEFMVGYTHLPELIIFFGGHHKILEKAKEIFLKKENATEVSFTDTLVDGFQSKDLVFKTNAGETGKALFVFDKKRVYLVMAKSSKGQGPIRKFTKSFQLLQGSKKN